MIRANTGQDTATPSTARVTDDQIAAWLDLEYPRFRREVTALVPTLYSTTTAEQALTAADPLFDLPADFERVVRFEYEDDDDWYPVNVADPLEPGGPVGVDGDYRLVYTKRPDLTGTYTLEVPEGTEEIPILRVCAMVVVRGGGGAVEDPSFFLSRADQLWREQKSVVRRRYGAHPVSGLRQVIDLGLYYREEAGKLVVSSKGV